MTSGPGNLYGLAKALLGAAAGIFVDNGQDAPDLQYVFGVGEPAAVCDQLVVSWDMIAPGVPGGTTTTAMPLQTFGLVMPRTAHLRLWCFRCIADVFGVSGLQLADPPDALGLENLAYTAEQVMTDAYILTRGIVAAHYAGSFKTFADGMAVGPAVPLQAAGIVGGCVLPIEAELS